MVRFEVKPVGLEDFPHSSSLICFLTLTFTILYMIGFEACPIKKKYFKTNDLYTFKILMLNGIQQMMYRNVQIDNIVHVLVSTWDLFCAAETPLEVVELLLSRDTPDFEEDILPLSGPIGSSESRSTSSCLDEHVLVSNSCSCVSVLNGRSSVFDVSQYLLWSMFEIVHSSLVSAMFFENCSLPLESELVLLLSSLGSQFWVEFL